MRLSSLKKQTGMTLTESLLVLAVGALIAVLAYGAYRMASSDVKVQSQVQGITQMVGKIKQVFGTGTDYNNVTIANVINARIVPADFKVNGTTAINNAWAGTITPAVGTNTAQFTLTITNVPAEGCMEFLSGISSSATVLTVGGTAAANTVKAAGGNYDAAVASTRCSAATIGDVVLTAQ